MRMLNIKSNIFLLSFYLLGTLSLIAQDNSNSPINEPNSNNFVPITYNPQPEAIVTINEDPRIKILLNLKAKMEKEGDFSDRYKIQLYYGNLNKANEIMETSKQEFPQWDSSIKWETPNFKVWLGNYRTRLDADRALKEVHEKFPNAFIFKPE
ncbi:SPOR domain-containing protein [Aquimarina gracilis]|uniref:SPOR domain-containing protein n=1 Tax=Aquimarina gracilis TaxID=874422 RepID=A0ABU5ZPW7_9FLAO|nr:SPOR domain-containing protein [Aquimarina gracilis]MEB3344141.1 SPOR domain-containing protein [Aquimarina gracilis]